MYLAVSCMGWYIIIVYQPKRRPNMCLTTIERRRCSHEATTPNPLKFAGVPQTRQLISAVSGPKFTCLPLPHILTSFFPIDDTFLGCEDIAQQICAMVHRWRVFASCISVSRMQHISDMHSTFALRPHHVWYSMVDIQSAAAENWRGKKKKPQLLNIMACPIGRP